MSASPQKKLKAYVEENRWRFQDDSKLQSFIKELGIWDIIEKLMDSEKAELPPVHYYEDRDGIRPSQTPEQRKALKLMKKMRQVVDKIVKGDFYDFLLTEQEKQILGGEEGIYLSDEIVRRRAEEQIRAGKIKEQKEALDPIKTHLTDLEFKVTGVIEIRKFRGDDDFVEFFSHLERTINDIVTSHPNAVIILHNVVQSHESENFILDFSRQISYYRGRPDYNPEGKKSARVMMIDHPELYHQIVSAIPLVRYRDSLNQNEYLLLNCLDTSTGSSHAKNTISVFLLKDFAIYIEEMKTKGKKGYTSVGTMNSRLEGKVA